MIGMTTRARRRVVATIPVLALAAAGLATMGATTASAAPSHVAAPVIGDDEYYMNYVAPRAEEAFGTDEEAVVDINGQKTGAVGASPRSRSRSRSTRSTRRATRRPLAGSRSSRASRSQTGKSPKALKNAAKGTQEAKLLTILVEFDENATDDFSDLVRADRVRLDGAASPARCRAARSTTASRTPPTTSSKTTTRCGCPTSPPSTSTRCSSPTRASRSACAPTSRAPTASPASTSPATR